MKIDLQEQFNRAVELLEKGEDLETADGIFNALLNIDSNSSQLLFGISGIQLRKKHFALADHLLQKVVELDPANHSAFNNLGFIQHNHYRNFDKAREFFKKAIEIKPDGYEYYMNLGGTYVAMNESDEAIKHSEKALELNPDCTKAKWHKALALLEKGDYANGWEEYAGCIRDENDKERKVHYGYDVQKWDGTPGLVVHVYGEQGIGDEIMFASMINDLASVCKLVIFDAHPRLYKLFRLSFPDNVIVYGTRKDKELAWPLLHKIDAVIPIGSLGKFYRCKATDYPGTPYLKVNEDLFNYYQRIRLGAFTDKPRIGISWKGGTKQTNAGMRHIPLEQWLPIFNAVDAEFISLQYTEDTKGELDKFKLEHPDICIHHWQDAIDNYDETAVLVANLDLIISVPQSVVHLAGALGVPTWQLTPKKSLWQMGPYGENMPWYNSVLNYWQDETETWEPVINKVKEDLCNLLVKSTES